MQLDKHSTVMTGKPKNEREWVADHIPEEYVAHSHSEMEEMQKPPLTEHGRYANAKKRKPGSQQPELGNGELPIQLRRKRNHAQPTDRADRKRRLEELKQDVEASGIDRLLWYSSRSIREVHASRRNARLSSMALIRRVTRSIVATNRLAFSADVATDT